MKIVTIDKNCFDMLKEVIGKDIKSKCKFCGQKISRDNFGYFSMNVTSCNNHICSIEAMWEDEKMDKQLPPKRRTIMKGG